MVCEYVGAAIPLYFLASSVFISSSLLSLSSANTASSSRQSRARRSMLLRGLMPFLMILPKTFCRFTFNFDSAPLSMLVCSLLGPFDLFLIYV